MSGYIRSVVLFTAQTFLITILQQPATTSLSNRPRHTKCNSLVSSPWAWQLLPLLPPPASILVPQPAPPFSRQDMPKLRRQLRLSQRLQVPKALRAQRVPLQPPGFRSLLLEAHWVPPCWASLRSCAEKAAYRSQYTPISQQSTLLTSSIKY